MGKRSKKLGIILAFMLSLSLLGACSKSTQTTVSNDQNDSKDVESQDMSTQENDLQTNSSQETKSQDSQTQDTESTH